MLDATQEEMVADSPHGTLSQMLAALLHGVGYAEKRITVLSAYVGQLLLLRAAFAACGLAKVLISTVDAYQGEENDIILLSLVRSNERGTLGFTSVDNRVCVALSRARLGFFCACTRPTEWLSPSLLSPAFPCCCPLLLSSFTRGSLIMSLGR